MSNRPGDHRHARPGGFTLFEVVIVLAIAALGLSFMVAAASSGLSNAVLADQFVAATRLAQSRFAEIGVTMPLESGVRSGSDGDGYTWQVRISTPVVQTGAPVSNMPPLGLYTIDVVVSWGSADAPKRVAFRSQRIARQ